MRQVFSAIAILAALGLSAPAPAQNADAAEVAFWNTVKDSRNPDELRAYLTAFPNGVFSSLARVRLQNLGAMPPDGAQRPTLSPAGGQSESGGGGGGGGSADEPAQTIGVGGGGGGEGGGGGGAGAEPEPERSPAVDLSNPAILREIQQKLYNLNYDPLRTDGVMNEQTHQAIREWQEVIKVPVTGVMTAELVQRLRNATTPSKWSAIAYTARGANGWVFGATSRAAAEQDAVARCQKEAGPNAECKPFTASGSNCETLATYTNTRAGTTYFGAHVAMRGNQDAATTEALKACREAENSGDACKVVVAICADGGHRR